MEKMERRAFLARAASVAAMAAAAGGGWEHALAAGVSTGDTAPGYFENQFGIGDELARRVLAKALSRGGDFADLFFEHSVRTTISLEDGKVNRANILVTLGVGVRTVRGDQVGYSHTDELTERAMLKAAGTAAAIASGSPARLSPQFGDIKIGACYPLGQLLADTPLGDRVAFVRSVNDRSLAMSPCVKKVTVELNDQLRRILVITSDSVKVEDAQPRNYVSLNVVAEKDGRRERAYWSRGGRMDASYYTPQLSEEIARETVDRALVLFDAVPAPAGEMPVVLGPGRPGVLLHEAIGHGMEADFNRKGISVFSEMIGKKVAEPFVKIVDDGTNMRMSGSVNVDDEGTPGQRTVLVENGILTGYLHDRISARHYSVKPTGNGRRESFRHLVVPRMRNTSMDGGEASPEDVIAAVKRGIYVKDVGNGQVKIGEGDFSFYVSQGRLIEDGKLTAPIKDVNIIGNGPKMLRNITMVGNDMAFAPGGAGGCGKDGQWVPVGFGLPTVLVKSMTVGGVKS